MKKIQCITIYMYTQNRYLLESEVVQRRSLLLLQYSIIIGLLINRDNNELKLQLGLSRESEKKVLTFDAS